MTTIYIQLKKYFVVYNFQFPIVLPLTLKLNTKSTKLILYKNKT